MSGSQVNVPWLNTAGTSSAGGSQGSGTWGSTRSGAGNEGISGGSVAGIVARIVATDRARRAVPAVGRAGRGAAQRRSPDRGASTNDVGLTAGTILGRGTAGTGSRALSTAALTSSGNLLSAVTGVLVLFFGGSEGGENGSRDGQKSREELHV